MSQVNDVLTTLRENTWVCGITFQGMFIPTYAQRVSDLTQKGYIIDRQKCNLSHHSHKGNVFMYMLRHDIMYKPKAEDQGELFAL